MRWQIGDEIGIRRGDYKLSPALRLLAVYKSPFADIAK